MQGVLGAVLAAGAGRRLSGPKALLPLRGATFLARVVEGLRRPGVEAVVVVVGHAAETVAAEAARAGADGILTNPAPDEGMLGSVLLAVEEAARRGAPGLLLHPVDHPLVSPPTVDAVVAALAAGARIAVPSWEQRRGHPAGFAASAFDALRQAPPAQGARAVLAAHPGWVVHVPGDASCRLGVNTPEDYARLLARVDG